MLLHIIIMSLQTALTLITQLKLTTPDFTALDHILNFPGQAKRKMFLLGEINVFANNL